MKYKCFCHVEHQDQLTREETRAMLRSYKNFTVIEFAEYYGIKPKDLFKFLKPRGVHLSSGVLKNVSKWEEYNSKHDVKKNRKSINVQTLDVHQWAIPVVCALGNVPFEVIKGKRSYDMEAYKKAVDILESQMANYFKEDVQDKSGINKSDLIAMRYFRGYNREKMAELLNVNKKDVVMLENEKPVPVRTRDLYKKKLNVSNSQINQLRNIMLGKGSYVEEDRTLKSHVKVAVFGRDNGQCVQCGSEKKLHYHHIIHFADGGLNTVENLQLLCATHHAEIHKDSPAYYMLKKIAEQE